MSRAVPRANYPGEGSLKQSTMCKWIQFEVSDGCRVVIASLFHHHTTIVSFIHLNITFEVVALPFHCCIRTHNLLFSHIIRLKSLQCGIVMELDIETNKVTALYRCKTVN